MTIAYAPQIGDTVRFSNSAYIWVIRGLRMLESNIWDMNIELMSGVNRGSTFERQVSLEDITLLKRKEPKEHKEKTE